MFIDYRRIEGFPEYIISNYGIVYSTKCGKVREMKCNNNTDGYKHVGLSKDKKVKTIPVHVLVGNAFIGLRTGEMTFDHEDQNIQNNRADNIRLATRSEQQLNQKIQKNNKSGERCISTQHFYSGYEYFKIEISRNKKTVFRKHLNKKKFCLEDAVKLRDDFLLTLAH